MGTMEMNPKNARQVVYAACVLHNFLCDKRDSEYLPPGSVDIIDGSTERGAGGTWRSQSDVLPAAPSTTQRNAGQVAVVMRDTFMRYFTGVGAVSWQLDHVTSRRSSARRRI